MKTEDNQPIEGRRVILDHMNDLFAPRPGTMGTITHVDDMGQIHVKWDNGSTLALVPKEDKFRYIK